ncbi:Nucleotide-binding universal stress protein, UspA family [Paramicrobacterium humi]|uniref:Nucleotide-binding universal stress protein, UspA family n=1 Tax=Paramicrobacterium humi TaxID=640635 RepID=A0A1H4MG08_9MICO|nr:universal stress protein [Microbacterium humi]SEB81654.1 Nucleotide-binding universal stress protein, UspA family [Microbacterium humi]
MKNPDHGPVLVGITGDQPDAVGARAVEFAKAFSTEIVFVWVDTTQYTSGFMSDGTVAFATFDPELGLEGKSEAPWLDERAAAITAESGVGWRTRVGAGQPAAVLAAIAEEEDARFIVVGTREPGFIAGLQEFLGGSVAAHLAHTQARPVILVPLRPVGKNERVPWDPEA